MKKHIISILIGVMVCLASIETSSSQGQNATWLMGYQSKVRMNFTNTSYIINPEIRKIPFKETQGNISDAGGNLLMSSNGYFIADATGDTMLNGTGLNPNQCTIDFGAQFGLPMPYTNLFLPMPGDSNQYILFHQTCDYNSATLNSMEVYYSVIDITLNSGLGSVINKNNVALNGNFATGMTACKHANGRDWWVIALSDQGTTIYKFLISPNFVSYMGSQTFSLQPNSGQSGQPVFSPNGEKFAFRNAYNNGVAWFNNLRLFDFDRCTGQFTLDNTINYSDGSMAYGWGTMFSPNSQFLYFATSQTIYQVDVTAPNIGSTQQIVAVNDTFLSASPVFYTNFYLMYLAANGKIYISSTSSVLHLHEMNYPDSAGITCDVQLHNIYTTHFYIGVPNHPNYYLGCDTTGSCTPCYVGIEEPGKHDFKFSISPNPNNGNFKIIYLLPQNISGSIEIFDINGRNIYSQHLPPWSTLQNIQLPQSVSSGVYNCVITSRSERINKKIAVIKE